jgi:hypothetical protein
MEVLPPTSRGNPYQSLPDAGLSFHPECHSDGTTNDTDPAPTPEEDAVPPIGDECQLPLEFAQDYGITAIRVLTTSQAPAW